MEVFNLNIIPGAVAPIIHASQYDEDREFRANLFEGDQVFTLTGAETISVNVRKPDGNVVTAAVVNTGSNYVDFSTTLQMTACAGANLCQLRIENSPRKIGTLNFILAVECDPLEGGIQSASEIHNLETQVAGMVAQEVATQYDSANVIFDATPTSGHGNGYAVTSEGIKTAINNAFDYDNTASGSIIHIEDGADNIPVKSLISEIEPIQAYSPNPPSPSNPRAISGFANGVVSVCGVNVWDETTKNGYWDATNGNYVSVASQLCSNDYIPVKENTAYYFYKGSTTNQSEVLFYDESKTFISSLNYSQCVNKAFTTPSNCAYITFNLGSGYGVSYLNNISFNYPSTDHDYHAYNGNNYTFTFGQTVYGGHFDNKGNLVVTYGTVDLGNLNWASTTQNRFYSGGIASLTAVPSSSSTKVGLLCSHYTEKTADETYLQNMGVALGTNGNLLIYDSALVGMTVAQVKTTLTGVQLVYPLATPTTLSITSQDVPTLLECNIFSNTGDLEVEYYTEKATDVLNLINSEIGKKNGTNILIEANSPDSIKTYIDSKTPNLYFLNDILLNSDGGTIIGVGTAMITMQNGIARIDFNLVITVAETVQNVFTWGINRDYFTALTGKQISPQINGSCVYYDANNVIYDDKMDLGGTFLVNGQFWQPSRVYDDNGTKKVGAWPSSAFQQNGRIVGTCYGTYT